MALGPHAAFIVACYGLAAGVIAGLIIWVITDYRRQRRILADLEARGVTRRFAEISPAPIKETA